MSSQKLLIFGVCVRAAYAARTHTPKINILVHPVGQSFTQSTNFTPNFPPFIEMFTYTSSIIALKKPMALSDLNQAPHPEPSNPLATVLIVDDNQNISAPLAISLRMEGYHVVSAITGTGGLAKASADLPDAILLDVRLPDMDGIDICRALKTDPKTRDIPVIFMTAVMSLDYKVKGLQAGAVDYMVKPVQHEEVLIRLQTHLKMRQLTKDLQAQNNRLELSNEVAQAIARMTDLDRMLHKVTSLIQSHLKYYFIALWLYDEARHGLVLQANESRDGIRPFDPGTVMELGKTQSIVMSCFQSLDPYLSKDVQRDANYLAMEDLPDTASELALPLRVGPLVLGAIDFQSDQRDDFGPDDLAVLEVLSNQIAVAVQNAQLYASIRRFSDNMEELVEQRTEELRLAYTKLEQIDNSKTKFIDVAAHELRTPLTVIRGYTQLLDTLVKDQPKVQDVVGSIVNGVDRLSVVVNSMLDVAKIDVDAVEIVPTVASLAQILNSVKREMARSASDRHVNLELEELGQLPVIQADSGLLQKVFYQLIVNAIKYTPDGGSVHVSGRMTQPEKDLPAGVEISIKDTGIGIDPQFQTLIFEKFYQTGSVSLHSSGIAKFKGGGPGLGLPIARGIILAHGGRIWVESPGFDEEKLPGSTFYVWLPIG